MGLDRFDGATIIRANHEKDYVVIHRHTAQDRNLSFEARGLLLYLLSKPDTWDIQIADLTQQCQKGRVYRILKELIDAGYIENREQKQLPNGQFEWTPYILHERPATNIVPFPEKPELVLPELENADVLVNTEIENKEKKTTSAQAPQAVLEASIPVQTNMKKANTLKLTKPEQDAWYDGVKEVWGYVGGRNVDYQKFVRGESTKPAFTEYALLKPLTKPEQLLAWGRQWKTQHPDLTMISSPAKVQDELDKFMAQLARPAPQSFQQRKEPANLALILEQQKQRDKESA